MKCGEFLESLGPVSFSGRTLLHGAGKWVGSPLTVNTIKTQVKGKGKVQRIASLEDREREYSYCSTPF
jgi:hypothetical protein